MTKLDAEVDDLIAACHGDTRGTVAALILVNQQLETELAELRARDGRTRRSMSRWRTPFCTDW